MVTAGIELRAFINIHQVMYVKRAFSKSYIYKNMPLTYVLRKTNVMHGL